MSFTIDMTQVYQQCANVMSSLWPLLFPFVAVAFALFLVGGLINLFKNLQQK